MATLMTGVMAITGLAAGCGGSEKTEGPTKATVSVRTADSTTKYRRSEITCGDSNYKLSYNMVKNEYESAQLFISADDDVSSYYLTKSDLKSGSNVLSAANIDVYMERFVTLTGSRDLTTYGEGDYPDALVPIDAAKAAGELVVDANQNSALWITVYAPKDTAPGLYTGTFELNVGGKLIDVPVEVNVNDYTLSDEIHAKTSFTWRYDRVSIGEFDYSTEMLETYYDFFTDYRISLENPVVDDSTMPPEQFAQAVSDNWDKITNYTFMSLYGLGPSGTMDGVKWTRVKSQILAIAEASTAERNLLEKGMFYFIDEPEFYDRTAPNYQPFATVISKIQGVLNNLQSLVKEMEADTSGKYDNFKAMPDWKEQIIGIPNIIPLDMEQVFDHLDDPNMQRFLTTANCLCPVWRNAAYPNFEELVKEVSETYDIEVWWYGCTQPNAPYATYHIGDTNMLSPRSITWLQMMYGIEGNLYWDAAAYTYYWGENEDKPCDLYEVPYRAPESPTDPAGDGFLTYAGAKYGVYGPLPSMRLMAIRDGNEEYEMLYDLKAKMAAKNDSNIDPEAEIDRLCSNLYYNGSMLYANGENGLDFGKVRGELINSLVDMNDGTDFYITSVKVQGAFAQIEFTANSDEYKVFFGNNEVQPFGNNMYKLTLGVGNKGYYNFKLVNKATGAEIVKNRFVAVAVKQLIDMNAVKTVPEEIVVKEGDSCYINTDGNKTSASNLGFVINSKITGNGIQDKIFTPEFEIKSSLFDAKFADMVYLHMDIYNLNVDVEEVTVLLKSGVKECQYTTISLQPGMNSVNIVLKGIVFSEIENTDSMVLRFENKGTQEAPYAHKICLDNVYAVVKGD